MSDRAGTVCCIARPDFTAKPGGDTVQWRLYSQVAREAGWDVVEWLDDRPMPAADVYHAFDVDKPFYLYPKLTVVRARGLRYLLSTIHHPYSWVQDFRRAEPPGSLLARVLYRSPLGRRVDRSEYAKDFIRALQARRVSAFRALFPHWRRRAGWLLAHAEQVWVLSRAEANWIEQDLGRFAPASRVEVIPNWVDGIGPLDGAGESPAARLAQEAVLMVGRIEARKNVLGAARLLEQAGVKALVVGRPNPNEAGYAGRLGELVAASRHVRWIPGVDRAEMAAIYRSARCLLNPSFAEVSPMVDIEALACGCPVITTRFALHHEILPPATPVVDPYDPASVLAAVRHPPARTGPVVVIDPAASREAVLRAYRRCLQ